MNIKRERILKDGSIETTVVTRPGEKLIAVRDDRYYTLGQPVEDVVPSDVLFGAQEVSWCCVTQRWVVS